MTATAITAEALRAQLGTDAHTLAGWLRDGLPHQGSEAAMRFDPAAVAGWLTANGHATAAAAPRIVPTLQRVAGHFHVGINAVRDWRKLGMPGRPKHWNLDEIEAWRRQRDQAHATRGNNGHAAADPLLIGPQSPALERYREERAIMARLERQEKERSLLPREAVRDGLDKIAATLRAAGDALLRQFGEEAQRILNDALDQAERTIETMLPPTIA